MNMHVTNATSSLWTAEQEHTCREMWAKGAFTADIAEKVGKTKSAVCGWINRNGLSRPKMPKRQRRQASNAKSNAGVFRRSTKQNPVLFVPQVTEISAPPLGVELMDLSEHHCRYICEGDGVEARFCGQHKVNGSYCQDHHKLTHIVGVPGWLTK
jgi:hypothetical protein